MAINKKQLNILRFFTFISSASFRAFSIPRHSALAGQSLIEILLIVILITAVISGSVGFLVQAYSITQLASDQTTATYLSMEGLELAKNFIDANYLRNKGWNDGFQNTGSYEVDYMSLDLGNELNSNQEQNLLKFDPESNRYGYFSENISINALPAPQQFKRRLEVTPIDTHEIKVVSVVDWVGRRCPSNGCIVKLENHFYDWR